MPAAAAPWAPSDPRAAGAPSAGAGAPVLLRAQSAGPEGEKAAAAASVAVDLEAGGGPVTLGAGAIGATCSRSGSTLQAVAANAARLLRLSCSSLDSETRQAVTFQDPRLLRGIAASRVLRNGGSVLSSSSGTERTYAMSKVVQMIDVFISHNWSTPRGKKFRVLALSFNLSSSLFLTLVLGLIFMALQAFGLLPTRDMTSSRGVRYQSSPFILLAGTAFFFLTLFKWHDIRNCLRIPGPTAFLDKACIDQVDEDRKREGIESLAAFVRHSRKMLVVYSDTYLHKLWTVYELACFMTLQPRNKLQVVPVFLADLLVMGISLFWLISILDTVSRMTAVHSALGGGGSAIAGYAGTAVFVLPCSVYFCKVWRNWMYELSRIHEQAAAFSVFKAECFCEGDRPLVQHSIAMFMKGIGLVPKDAPEDVALEAFDRKVHLEVPRALEESVGRVGILYRHACVIFLPLALVIMDGIGVALNEGEPALVINMRVVGGATTYLAVYPALLALVSLAMWASLRLQSCTLIWASYIITATTTVVATAGWGRISAALLDWAIDSAAGRGAFLAVNTTMFLLAAFLYRRYR